MAETLYSKDFEGSIITPTCVVRSNKEKFQGYIIVSDCDNGTGYLKILHRNGFYHSTFPLQKNNVIWFHTYNAREEPTPKVHRMNDACLSALWHGQLRCAGNSIMDVIHKHFKGIDRPLQRNLFYKCSTCLPNWMRKRSIKKKTKGKSKQCTKRKTSCETSLIIDVDDTVSGEAGQHFHMDFDFVKGSD